MGHLGQPRENIRLLGVFHLDPQSWHARRSGWRREAEADDRRHAQGVDTAPSILRRVQHACISSPRLRLAEFEGADLRQRCTFYAIALRMVFGGATSVY